MSVDNKNSEADEFAPTWRMMRHVLKGAREMREHARDYIPMLSDQTADEYEAYVMRAAFLEATARTREALSGIIFRKPLFVEGLEDFEDFTFDVDTSGKALSEFAQNIVDDQFATNWGAIIVSHTGDPSNPGTAANPLGRPVMRYVSGESILDWEFGRAIVNGKPANVLISIRLAEVERMRGKTEFERVEIPQIRVMDLDEAGLFRERIYRESEKKRGEWELFSVAEPMLAGGRMTSVPAVLVSGTGDKCPATPPLAPVAEINVSHWRTMADLEHAAHFCGLPTPYVTGVSMPTRRGNDIMSALENSDVETGLENLAPRRPMVQEPSLRLGSTRVLTLENVQARAGFMEFTGQGVSTLEKLADRKEAQMAALGARMLAPEKSSAESGDALAIRKASETAPLVKMVRYISDALTAAVNIALVWSGREPNAIVELNSEFSEVALTPEEMTALLTAWQGGAISHDTLLFNFKRGGRLADDRTPDDEKEIIQTEAPAQRALPFDPFANPGAMQ